MQIFHVFYQIKIYIFRALLIQFFLTLLSLPILIMWGLPISGLTMVGNIIMAPFLSIFLFFASCIFFTELFFIPNSWLIHCAEFLSQVWLNILQFHPRECLFGFKKPSILMMLLMSILFFWLLFFRSKKAKNYFLMLSLSLGALIVFNNAWYAKQPGLFHIPCNKGMVILMTDTGKTILIDSGYIASHASAVSWVEHTLVSTIIKNTGLMHIDYLIVLQPRPRLFQALIQILPTLSIKYVIMPTLEGILDGEIRKHYNIFVDTIKQHNGVIVEPLPENITLSKNSFCILHKKSRKIRYQQFFYQPFEIEINHYGEKSVITSAYYIKNQKPLSANQKILLSPKRV